MSGPALASGVGVGNSEQPRCLARLRAIVLESRTDCLPFLFLVACPGASAAGELIGLCVDARARSNRLQKSFEGKIAGEQGSEPVADAAECRIELAVLLVLRVHSSGD